MDALDKAMEEDNIGDYITDSETQLEAFILKEEMDINTFPKKNKGIRRICEKGKTCKKVIHDVVKRATPIKRQNKKNPHDSDGDDGDDWHGDDWIISLEKRRRANDVKQALVGRKPSFIII